MKFHATLGPANLAAPPARDLPIVVMSSSNQESDVQRAMALGAAAYQVKSGDLQFLVAFAKDLREKWLNKENVKAI